MHATALTVHAARGSLGYHHQSLAQYRWHAKGRDKLLVCPCRTIAYCSRECQVKHWREHRVQCTGPLNERGESEAMVKKRSKTGKGTKGGEADVGVEEGAGAGVAEGAGATGKNGEKGKKGKKGKKK